MPAQSSPTPISSTYRVQFNKDFTFQDATNLLDYLSDLGITHLYASPILTSRRGSTHGYDVVDPTRLNPEIGTEADFAVMQEKLHSLGMGMIVDIVPNHMSASSENLWWMDVLEYGLDSAYAAYFDIDWHPPQRTLDAKILLPILGGVFAEVLERQELKLSLADGKFFVQYFESLFPVAPRTYRRILKHRIDQLKAVLGEDSPVFHEYSGIVAAFSTIGDRENEKSDASGNRRLQFEAARERLRQLVANSAYVDTFLQQNLNDFNGEPGNPASFSLLERLLDEQHYVLAYWQNVNVEINYRRFFTINDLVGIRIEDSLVFDATHNLVARMVEQGAINGLRIDHVDGLRDPVGYLNRLNERVASLQAREPKRIPIFVEKILARSEDLPADWPAAGTTGYEFVNALNSFFVHPRGTRRIEQIYCKFLGREFIYDDVLYQKKRLVMASLLGVEMRALAHHLEMLASNDRYARDLPVGELTQALLETTANLHVYRTYLRNLDIAAQDEARIEHAIAEARARRAQLNTQAFDFLRDVLLVRNQQHLLPGQREDRLAFVLRWQQFTGPLMAKAFEDTFLYVYTPLISLNDVGGDPRPSMAPSANFLKFLTQRSRHWPHSMNTTTTHDTKRSEDVRARVNVLSEVPDEWEAHVNQWSKWNAAHRKVVSGQPVPDRNEEIFLYQTLLGMWPQEPVEMPKVVERLQAYAIKATREAMVHTRWTKPNVAHESALQGFISGILNTGAKNRFLSSFSDFEHRLAYYGMVNGLSQMLLKIISPGFPDFYQGSELWDLRLVDPDNRQPVDFARRKSMLGAIRLLGENPAVSFLQEFTSSWKDGRVKLFLIWKALNFRRDHSELFSEGGFTTLRVIGRRRENIAAFERRYQRESILAIVPRWLARANRKAVSTSDAGFWANTQVVVPFGKVSTWRNVLTGEEAIPTGGKERRSIAVSQLLKHFPVALLFGRELETPSQKKRKKRRVGKSQVASARRSRQ
jgi:(1->4)-alpha-D-glucan 1-alpha-D-glucosylmutase